MDEHRKEERQKWFELLKNLGEREIPEDDDALKLLFAALVCAGHVTWAELNTISYARYNAEPEDWSRPAWKSFHLMWLFVRLVNQFLDDHEPDFNRVVGGLLAHLDTDSPSPILREITRAATDRAHQALKLETN